MIAEIKDVDDVELDESITQEEERQTAAGLLDFLVSMHNILINSYRGDGDEEGIVLMHSEGVKNVILSLRSVADNLAEGMGITIGEGVADE